MKNRITKRMAMLAVLCVMIMAFAAPALAASYSRVYGQTQDRVRVRTSASSSATIFDNIVKGACVYVTESKTSGGSTFVKVNYRNSDGDIGSGWVCQHDGKTTLVKILSAAQAKSAFSVENGVLPSKKVGTFTKAERNKALNAASTSSSSSSSSSSSTSSGSANTATVKSVQTMLKALGYYTGEITGNVGTKTKTAIQKFQKEYELTADGVIGPKTLAKLTSVYQDKKGTSSGSTASSSSTALKLGSSGTRVRNLQQDLTTLGYYWAEITGNFGSKTETAVKSFQQKNNLTADGVAGTKTLVAISEAIARKGSSSSGTSTYPSGTTLKLDSQGAAVSQLQKDLKQLGYYYSDITGNFGTKTEAAVKEFQADRKLTADGVAGTKTLNAIKDAIAAAGGSASSSTGGLKVGSTGDKVIALQQDLTALGYYYGDITGHYGSMTKTAVQKFQKAKGITQDGIAGTSTLAAIAKALGGSSSSSGSGSSSLREGDKGSAVLELQTMLKELGFYYGELTGSFGSLTKTAVRKFQDANGLTVDGIAGAKTISLLRSMTGRGSGSGAGGSITSSSVADADSYFKLNKDGVRLRATYSLSAAAKTTMDKGDVVKASRKYNVGGTIWYYITVKQPKGTYSGYVRSTVLTKITKAEYEAVEGAGSGDSEFVAGEILGMIRITANNVAIRENPSSSSTSMGKANMGDVFFYMDKSGSWYQIQSGYWISSSYAKVMTDSEVEDYINSGNYNGDSYHNGDTGVMVTWIQESLKQLGYYSGDITGHYGNKTEDAVREFQRDHGLSADGIAGTKTINKLMEEISKDNAGGSGNATYNAVIYNVDWFANKSKINSAGIRTGYTATMIDIATGRSMKIKIQSTGNHADVEPLTANDTKVLCSLYGVTNASQLETMNKWQRRAVVVEASNGDQFVGSIYAIPHGANTVAGNNFDGQFCVHFKGSTIHSGDGGSVAAADNHQAKIEAAVKVLESMKNPDGTRVTTVVTIY